MAKTHYIAMSGEHGCLPDHCQSYDTLRDAVGDLVSLFELGRRRQTELRRTLSLELGRGFGAEYCEIVECDCDDPDCHCDEGPC